MTNNSSPEFGNSLESSLPASPATPARTTAQNSSITYTTELLTYYCFDLESRSAQQWIELWLKDHPEHWFGLAVVEALYLGRYKAISVEQILVAWKRRSKPLCHFTHEFERLICRHFPNSHTLPNQPQLGAFFLTVPRSFRAVAKVPKSLPRPIVSSPAPSISSKTPSSSVDCPQEATLVYNRAFTENTKTENPQTESTQSESEPISQPILQFVPTSIRSDFFTKLRAVILSAQETKPNASRPLQT